MKYPGEPLNILHTIGLKELYPLIRISFSVDDRFDVGRFKKAIIQCNEVVPELFSKYVLEDNSFIPVTDDLEGVLFMGLDPDIDIERWDLFADPQLRIYLNKSEEGYDITIYLSHILTDGAGGKQFLYLLASAYNTGKIDEVNHQDIDWLRQLLKEHPVKTNRQVDHPAKPLTMPALADGQGKRRRTLTIRLSKAETNQLCQAAHHKHVTLNDLFMAAFGQAVQRYADTDEIALACPTDMRQFIPGAEQLRIANHTSRYNIAIKSDLRQPFETVVKAVHQTMANNKQKFQCFQSIKELIDKYDQYPLAELQQIVEDNYHVRNISYTNFGIIDPQRFTFADCAITGFSMLGTYRKYPMFQVAISTYCGQVNLSFAMIGSDAEERMARAVVLTMRDLLREYFLRFN
ncbi:hypothetical protein H5S40_05775 [Limosilactobacillus sp. RRLNB_1_1]|uniref:Condensation domain-containing protein n=1 Tax=Limosilactobacillus albertensis TaxID=2759752 RepID=A0A7W3Y8M9_9LACO|nr:condensation domain-containing protein [Limosilactobacillus albertensis]MBB1069657.1 hypothetical protein [Limosilactobacillus albertensis]MCD7118144.1 condensation domain-containing protein [Limosilactobacillus albertensis]MCD7127958.1 condensation domain-containing protein [Limosilactobacillus albertensis]